MSNIYTAGHLKEGWGGGHKVERGYKVGSGNGEDGEYAKGTSHEYMKFSKNS